MSSIDFDSIIHLFILKNLHRYEMFSLYFHFNLHFISSVLNFWGKTCARNYIFLFLLQLLVLFGNYKLSINLLYFTSVLLFNNMIVYLKKGTHFIMLKRQKCLKNLNKCVLLQKVIWAEKSLWDLLIILSTWKLYNNL